MKNIFIIIGILMIMGIFKAVTSFQTAPIFEPATASKIMEKYSSIIDIEEHLGKYNTHIGYYSLVKGATADEIVKDFADAGLSDRLEVSTGKDGTIWVSADLQRYQTGNTFNFRRTSHVRQTQSGATR